MIEFLKKNQKNISTGAAGVLLIICYLQQKELAKLRKETHVVQEVKADTKKIDSLLTKGLGK